MLSRGKKLVIFIAVILNSCSNENELKSSLEEYDKARNARSIKEHSIYRDANDSIQKWVRDSLSIVEHYIAYPYELNEIFIFNLDSTRFYTTINTRDNKNKDAIFDFINDFGGAKIAGKQYFFFSGTSEPVDRSYWKDDYNPLTFEELNYIAYERRLKKLIQNIDNGHPEKNDVFFINYFYSVDKCKGELSFVKKCCDSIVLKMVSEKYKYKVNFKDFIGQDNNNQHEPIVKSSRVKILESAEWKSRHN